MLDTPELKQSGIIKEIQWDIHSVMKLAGSQAVTMTWYAGVEFYSKA
jgi:hypothetical protein